MQKIILRTIHKETTDKMKRIFMPQDLFFYAVYCIMIYYTAVLRCAMRYCTVLYCSTRYFTIDNLRIN